MKIFILNTYYQGFLDHFYAKNGEITSLSYEDRRARLLAEQFGTSDFYSKNLKALGHQAKEHIVNDERLQKKWAKENGVSYRRGLFGQIPKLRAFFKSDWLEKIVEAQINAYDPDVIYSHNLSVLSPAFMEKIKRGSNGKKRLLVGQIACPLPPEAFLKVHDLILTSFPHFVPHFRSLGIRSEYFRLGFEKTILDTLPEQSLEHDAVFVGTFGSKHEMGTALLEELARKTNFRIWGRGITNVRTDSPLQKIFQGEAWGKDMYRILHNSKISINRHIDVAENYANNMRLFESTGVGALLITDKKDNLHELFEIGTEVETYETVDELVEKINYYLSHEPERSAIAKRGQERTLRDHTYARRMAELCEILGRYI